MADSRDTLRWIRSLAEPDPGRRASAASHVHSLAAALCEPVIRAWMNDLELRVLLTAASGPKSDRAEKPHMTVGIAVQPAAFDEIRAANRSPRLANVPPDQDAMEFELAFGDGFDLDILTSRDPGGSGAIARYLQKFGEGIQQIEFDVSEVDRATEILRTRFALAPVYPATRAGADGTRVNFFLVSGAEGKKVLIELVEKAP